MKNIKKDKSIIPKGMYCYTLAENPNPNACMPKFIFCSYWSRRDDKPEQMDGYCDYLKIGDWMEGGFSMLWDAVKECGINEDWDRIEVENTGTEAGRINK